VLEYPLKRGSGLAHIEVLQRFHLLKNAEQRDLIECFEESDTAILVWPDCVGDGAHHHFAQRVLVPIRLSDAA
jgi:hypothetical protein